MATSQDLQSLGLTEKQAWVYFALLESGISSAPALAKKAGIKRPTTYLILDELIGLGIVAPIPRSGKKLYRALHPDNLLDQKKRDLRRVEKIIPEIEALMRESGTRDKPHVMFFEGVEGIKEILDYNVEEMSGKTIYGFYATGGEEVQKQFDYFKQSERKRIKLNIKAKGIAPDDPENLARYREEDASAGREIKVLPKNAYSSNISIEIGENWVKTNDFENLQGLIIENPAFSKTMREIFEIVWNTTK